MDVQANVYQAAAEAFQSAVKVGLIPVTSRRGGGEESFRNTRRVAFRGASTNMPRLRDFQADCNNI